MIKGNGVTLGEAVGYALQFGSSQFFYLFRYECACLCVAQLQELEGRKNIVVGKV
jgi:hypothetical protein